MTRSYKKHDSLIWETWIVHTRSFIRETWLVNTRDMTRTYERHDSFTWEHDSLVRKTWLVHMRDRADSCEGHDSSIRNARFFHLRDTMYSYVRHYSFIWETWQHTATHCNTLQHTATWDITLSYERHGAFKRKTWLIHTKDTTSIQSGEDP